MTEKLSIYTVGHSTQTQESLIRLLKEHQIEIILDVRSVPYSKIAPQFNKDALHSLLKDNHILYGFMGEQLGARHKEKNVLTPSGQVDFSQVAKLPSFNAGIDRLLKGMPSYRIALMCSERDPMSCHRFGLISKNLAERGVQIFHITPSGLVTEQELEKRMVEKYYPRLDLMFSNESPTLQAFRCLNQDIGFETESYI